MTPCSMNAAPEACLDLQHGLHRVRVAPAAGGRILYWRTELAAGLRDWLVPIDVNHWPGDAWPKGGLFPLAPFSNRVRDARLHWQGRTIALAAQPGSPHALHGQAQRMAWSTRDAGPDHATLVLEHPAGVGGWPWDWRLLQVIRLTDQGLQVDLALTNSDLSAMPAGLGLHPYFTAHDVQLQATARWPHEQELTLARAPEPNQQDRWVRDAGTWTAYLSGCSGPARLGWGTGPGLLMQVHGPLTHRVLHCNAGRYLCVEPATHVCDAFNLAAAGIAGTGSRTLAPGDTLEVGMTLGIQS